MFSLVRNLLINRTSFNNICSFSVLTKDIKKFYKNVSVSLTEGLDFEVNLDHRKLRTPGGKVFKVPNEALALAVAQEWYSQGEIINKQIMHLTNLCNRAIDNPTERSPQDTVNATMAYLDTDTIRFQCVDPPDLFELQQLKWSPIIKATEKRYNLDPGSLPSTTGFSVPFTPQPARLLLAKHILGYNSWALTGFYHLTECLKSFLLALALADRELHVDEAVQLTRIEIQYQSGRWGEVAWYHCVDQVELEARAAAALMLIHSGHERRHVQYKAQTKAALKQR